MEQLLFVFILWLVDLVESQRQGLDQFRALGQRNVAELKRLVNSKGWTVDVDDFTSKVVVESKFFPEYNRTIIKSTAIRKSISAADIFEEGIRNPTDITKYNKDTDFMRIIKILDSKNRILHAQVTPKGTFNIPSRDSVSLQTWDYDGESFWFAYSSVDWPAIPPVPGVVRVDTYPSGNRIRPLKPKGVELTAIINIDPKPPTGVQLEVIDLFTKYKQVSFYEEFFDYLDSKKANKKSKKNEGQGSRQGAGQRLK